MFGLDSENIKEKMQGALKNDTSTKLLSLALAVLLWFAISVSVYPTINKPVYNVPIVIDLEGTYAEANSLEKSARLRVE